MQLRCLLKLLVACNVQPLLSAVISFLKHSVKPDLLTELNGSVACNTPATHSVAKALPTYLLNQLLFKALHHEPSLGHTAERIRNPSDTHDSSFNLYASYLYIHELNFTSCSTFGISMAREEERAIYDQTPRTG